MLVREEAKMSCMILGLRRVLYVDANYSCLIEMGMVLILTFLLHLLISTL